MIASPWPGLAEQPAKDAQPAAGLAAGRPRVALLGMPSEEGARLAEFLNRVGLDCVAVAATPAGPATGSPAGPRADPPDLAVVRIERPDDAAFRHIARLRQQGGVPVVILHGDRSSRARRAALRAGAEDCLQYPFSPSELALRLRAIHRRLALRAASPGSAAPAPGRPERIQLGPLVIHRPFRMARVGPKPLALTRREFELLWLLASHPGRVFTREELLLRLWGDEEAASQECVTVLVSRLRRKLRAVERSGGVRIRALWGVGYRLEPAPPSGASPAGAPVPARLRSDRDRMDGANGGRVSWR